MDIVLLNKIPLDLVRIVYNYMYTIKTTIIDTSLKHTSYLNGLLNVKFFDITIAMNGYYGYKNIDDWVKKKIEINFNIEKNINLEYPIFTIKYENCKLLSYRRYIYSRGTEYHMTGDLIESNSDRVIKYKDIDFQLIIDSNCFSYIEGRKKCHIFISSLIVYEFSPVELS